MKKLSFYSLAIPFFFLLFSCGEEEDSSNCEPPSSLAENIIGSWNVDGRSQVTFNTDGTYDDPNNLLGEVELNGVALTETTFVVESETLLRLRWTAPSGSPTSSQEKEITKNDCDEINFLEFGDTVRLTR